MAKNDEVQDAVKKFHCGKCEKDFSGSDGLDEDNPAIKMCPYCGNRRIGERIVVVKDKGEE